MERFFGTLKRECTSRERFQTEEEARTVIFEYMVAFYNRVRIHSNLGYLSPVQFEVVNSCLFSFMRSQNWDSNTSWLIPSFVLSCLAGQHYQFPIAKDARG